MNATQTAPTTQEYTTFQQAYDFFNAELFGGTLPQVLIVLQRKSKALGYFCPNRFAKRTTESAANGKMMRLVGMAPAHASDVERVHELAMNPDHFGHQTDLDICDTLVHEMAHVWQQAHGKPSRKGYHDKQWAAKMIEIGLQPSDTGKPGGKITGVNMSDYPIEGGAFLKAFAKLARTGFTLHWESREIDEAAKEEKKKKKASKTKYTCPVCDLNAWAKPDTALICGDCYEDGDVIPLEAVEAPEEVAA